MPVVVKFGGSLFREPELFGWVCRVLKGLQGCVVVVPGGGAFADCVSKQQNELRFDDETAHLLAILAMEQNGHVLANLVDRLVTISQINQFPDVWGCGKVPVWLPFKECLSDLVLPRDWSVTSDAIAARLAERMGEQGFGRTGVVLMKSCVVETSWSVDKMVQLGVVDPNFDSIVSRAGLAFRVLGALDVRSMESLVSELDTCST